MKKTDIGYARVLTEEHSEARQLESFRKAISKIFTDKCSGKNMKRSILLAALLLTGCTSAQEEEKPYELNERQKNLLAAVGLPQDYEQLSPQQQHTIRRTEDLLSYMEDTYDESFIYVDYHPAELMESEWMVCYPERLGDGGGKYLITVKVKDSSIVDNYSDFSVMDYMEELIRGFWEEEMGENGFLYIMSPLACNIKMPEVIDGNFLYKIGAENLIRLKLEHYEKKEAEVIIRRYAAFLQEHQISGSHRIDMCTELDPAIRDVGDLMESEPYLGFYSFSFINDYKDIAIGAYIKKGECASLNHQVFPLSEFIPGITLPQIEPIALLDVTYHGQKGYDRVMVDKKTGRHYRFGDETLSDDLSPPKLTALLKKAGWEFNTNREDNFSYSKDGRTVTFRLERIPFPENQINKVDIKYTWELHLKVNGEACDDRLPYNYVVTRNDMPTLKRNDEYLLHIELSEDDLEGLFWLRLLPDHKHSTGMIVDVSH